MRIDICVVLVKDFIDKTDELLLLGSSKEIFEEIFKAALDANNEEIMVCLDRIYELKMVENCFPENYGTTQAKKPQELTKKIQTVTGYKKVKTVLRLSSGGTIKIISICPSEEWVNYVFN